MDEKNRNRRGLEDISHFFLSGDNPHKPSDDGEYEKGRVHKNIIHTEGDNGSSGDGSQEGETEIQVARPADAALRNEINIVEAAEEFLRNARPGGLASVKNIRSTQFGGADLTLFNKEESIILCGKIQNGQWFSDFLVSSLGYYAWLKESLAVGSPFFESHPRLHLYLFCDRFPSSARQVLTQMKETMAISLIQYHLLQIPDRQRPVVYFQPLVSPKQWDNPAGTTRRETSDISKNEWVTLNRLKDRASQE